MAQFLVTGEYTGQAETGGVVIESDTTPTVTPYTVNAISDATAPGAANTTPDGAVTTATPVGDIAV